MVEAIEKPKRKRGGQEFIPTAHQKIIVRTLKAIGYVNNADIALAVIDPKTGKGISVPTLLKAFPEEMREGKLISLSRIVNVIYRQALKGNMKAAQMLMIALAPEDWGFRAHLRIIASGKGGGGEDVPAAGQPLPPGSEESLTDEELEEIVKNYEETSD